MNFSDANFNPLMLREPDSLTVLPEALRPIPDNEKEELCVMGKHLQQTEAAGKFEDFWTLSHTSVVNEEVGTWSPFNFVGTQACLQFLTFSFLAGLGGEERRGGLQAYAPSRGQEGWLWWLRRQEVS